MPLFCVINHLKAFQQQLSSQSSCSAQPQWRNPRTQWFRLAGLPNITLHIRELLRKGQMLCWLKPSAAFCFATAKNACRGTVKPAQSCMSPCQKKVHNLYCPSIELQCLFYLNNTLKAIYVACLLYPLAVSPWVYGFLNWISIVVGTEVFSGIREWYKQSLDP